MQVRRYKHCCYVKVVKVVTAFVYTTVRLMCFAKEFARRCARGRLCTSRLLHRIGMRVSLAGAHHLPPKVKVFILSL